MTEEQLKQRDFWLVIDKSASMEDALKDGSERTRWEEAAEITGAFASKMRQYDDDGISLLFFSGEGSIVVHNNVKDDKEKIKQLFQENSPYGGTATHAALQTIFDDWLKQDAKERKPVIAVVITDGEPNDMKLLKTTIIEFTKKLDKDEDFGITFIQIGDNAKAEASLKVLDDDLVKEGAAHDIVDTIKSSEIEASGKSLTDVLIAAVVD